MQIRKKWLYKLTNLKKNIFKNIIWHLFAVKITVAYCGSACEHVLYMLLCVPGMTASTTTTVAGAG